MSDNKKISKDNEILTLEEFVEEKKVSAAWLESISFKESKYRNTWKHKASGLRCRHAPGGWYCYVKDEGCFELRPIWKPTAKKAVKAYLKVARNQCNQFDKNIKKAEDFIDKL
jgi:hypothetical protein